MEIKEFYLQNNILLEELVYGEEDEQDQKALFDDKLYQNDVHYFKKCKISLSAALQMLAHSLKGIEGEEKNEIMGMVLGKVIGDTFIITDTIPLCAGCEFQVQANDQIGELLLQSLDLYQKSGRKEEVRGWYHSHPDFGCFLSKIDVRTQRLQQKMQGPIMAIVIDPIKTMRSNKLDIGVFRTYPELHIFLDEEEKMKMELKEQHRYFYNFYSLEVSYFINSTQFELISQIKNLKWVDILTSNLLFESCPHERNDLKYLSDCIQNISKIGNSCKCEENKEEAIVSLTLKELKEDKHKYTINQILQYSLKQNQTILNEGIKNLLFSYSI